ncbi:MAG: hypothetical protein QGG36_24235 [Pirellulaceae bacterium]|jgi:alpha-mannosidase|nr:hypothetical protein [Pirellulaceae bacterium]MDP7018928.1 hypothetical protein [Pirellulaceae bacterium]
MKYTDLTILLPCHSLEDFPVHHEGDDAQGLLAAWTALWHPALIHSVGKMPSWARVDDPPDQLSGHLLVIPAIALNELPTGFVQRAKDEGAVVIRKKLDRQEILAEALKHLNGPTDVDEDLAADFLALGYCYLQIELLTRQMRYSSNLDEIHFDNLVVKAAAVALGQQVDDSDAHASDSGAGDSESTTKIDDDDAEPPADEAPSSAAPASKDPRASLASCFDVLSEERDYYYSVESYLLDITLLAPSTLGSTLEQQLTSSGTSNLLLNAELLERMATEHPRTLAALRTGLAEQRVGVISGDLGEAPWPLMSCESMLDQWLRSLEIHERLLDAAPRVFGRRRFGLTPAMPQVLQKLGYEGAFHATLDEGRFPEGSQVKVRWESVDGSAIDALGRPPVDASKPDPYLGLALKLGETMDTDHVATLCLAHWPGQYSCWHDDLVRTSRYTSCLGKFVRIEEFFANTEAPYHGDRFEADQYRSPYLKQAVIRRQADPISAPARYWRRRAAIENLEALETLSSLMQGRPPKANDNQWKVEVDRALESADEDDGRLDGDLETALQTAADQFAAGLPRSGDSANGVLVLNPTLFVRRNGVDAKGLSGPPTVERPVYAASTDASTPHVMVDTPSMGYAWLTPAAKPTRVRRPQLLANEEEHALRNEFFEAIIDPVTGTLGAIYEYSTRGNRLSQQLAFRLPTPAAVPGAYQQDDSEPYTVMAADSVEVTRNTTTVGEITCRGRLLRQDGSETAKFEQRYQMCKGSRVLRLDIELEPGEEPKSDAWNSYYACRFAWADEAAGAWRGLHQMRHGGETKRLEAPTYIELENGSTSTTLLTGGLPYHHRTGYRMLDSLLIVRGERARSFTLGVGIDLKYPLNEAMNLLCPPTLVAETAAAPTPASSYLFHIDSRNVVSTHWSPLVEGDAVIGFRARLLETSGRTARAKLSAFRPLGAVRVVDFRGKSLGDCALDDGAAKLELAANEWVEIEAKWASPAH